MSTRISRCRVLASIVVSAGLCLLGTTTLAAPTQAAAGSCDDFFPVAELAPGQTVNGLTVTQGDSPSSGSFTGTIIGVLADGIEPDVDMVIADLTSPQIAKSGIWEGMSGSPVYADSDGRLIGAVAYTLSYGPTTVAGITPWEQTPTYAGGPAPAHVRVGDATARRIARATDVTVAEASQGFVELRAPQVVVGLGARALSRATGRPYLDLQVAPAGRAASSPSATDMVAGANLVATESTGDIVFAALGTITSVCDNRVVGFGHPMEFFGRSARYGMAGADTLYIQSDALGPSYKVANLGTLLGSIDQDRMTGISGLLGKLPADFPVTSHLSYTPDGGVLRQRTGTSHVQLPMAAASITFYEAMTNHQKVLDAYQGGTEAQVWTITGTSDKEPFVLSAGNRYTDSQDIAYGGAFDLPDLVWLLGHVGGVTIDSIDEVSEVTDNTVVHEIQGLQQRVAGVWMTVDRTHPARLTAGRTAVLRMQYGRHVGRLFKVVVPLKAAGARGRLFLEQSPQYWFERDYPRTFAGVQRLVDTMPRNDQAVYTLYAEGEMGGVSLHGLTRPEGKVITGAASFKVRIR